MTIQEARVLTACFIGFVVVITIGYDVWVFRAFGPNATISRVCGTLFQQYPLTFAWVLIGIGLYLGHAHIPAW
jgi:hypothetical protein